MRFRGWASGWRVVVPGLLALVWLGVSGCCEAEADVESPLKYDKAGVAFDYPGNWKTTDESVAAENRYVMVETPGDAIVVVTMVSADEAASLEVYARAFADEARKNTPVGDLSASTFSEVSGPLENQAMTETFAVSLAGESLNHTRHHRRIESGGAVCFVLAQAADEDLGKVLKGFELIFSSIKCAAL